jgi:glycine/D-amino acid oxidase-like deaminating enzyme
MGAQREAVAVVGGGIAGVCSALALGSAHDAIVLELLDALLTQTSRSRVPALPTGAAWGLAGPDVEPSTRRSSSSPPIPCITPSTDTNVVIVSFMVAVPSRRGFSKRRRHPWGGCSTGYSTRSASATAQEAERSDAGALGSEQASERSVVRQLLRTAALCDSLDNQQAYAGTPSAPPPVLELWSSAGADGASIVERQTWPISLAKQAEG